MWNKKREDVAERSRRRGEKGAFFLLSLSTPRVRFVDGRPFFQLFSHTCPSFPSPPPFFFFSWPSPSPLGIECGKMPWGRGRRG